MGRERSVPFGQKWIFVREYKTALLLPVSTMNLLLCLHTHGQRSTVMTSRKPYFYSVIQSLLRSLVCKSDFKKGSFPQTHSVQVYWSPITAVSRFEWFVSRSTRFFRRTDTCCRNLSCQILPQIRCFSLLRSLVLSISLAIPSPCT